MCYVKKSTTYSNATTHLTENQKNYITGKRVDVFIKISKTTGKVFLNYTLKVKYMFLDYIGRCTIHYTVNNDWPYLI